MFAENLRKLRKLNNLTQPQFAEKFHIASGTIAMWETGKRQPDIETIKKIADFFNVSVNYLLGDDYEGSEIETARQIIKQLHSTNDDITISEIEKFTGVNYATFRCWYEGIGDYFNDKLNILAQLYKVSVDYLLGNTAIPNPIDTKLTSFEFALFGEIKDMTDAEKQDILDYIRYKKQKAE